MNPLNNKQFKDALSQEETIRKQGLMNPDKGFVGNGFWWGYYPTFVSAQSGYGGYMTSAMPQAPVSDSGETATASDGSGVSAVGGMASN
jgi:hypothetical protein